MGYISDILGDDFEQKTISLKNDYEGENKATLIRRLSKKAQSNTAVLYIHGFNDYFFQRELAETFNLNGYNFYALDLRKYGRSYMEHQTLNDIRDLKSYYEEIDKAADIIKTEENHKVILMGHSTGGLISTLYAKDNTGQNRIDGLILNSPFFDFNVSSWILSKLIVPASAAGQIFPCIRIKGALSKEYGESLHKDYNGEWDYKLKWKPNTPPPITLGWLRAVRKGHLELSQPFTISEPVLILHSEAAITDKEDTEQMHTMDAVLSVEDIKRAARNIKGDTDIVSIEGGMHDLILSKKGVREHVYQAILKWMRQF